MRLPELYLLAQTPETQQAADAVAPSLGFEAKDYIAAFALLLGLYNAWVNIWQKRNEVLLKNFLEVAGELKKRCETAAEEVHRNLTWHKDRKPKDELYRLFRGGDQLRVQLEKRIPTAAREAFATAYTDWYSALTWHFPVMKKDDAYKSEGAECAMLESQTHEFLAYLDGLTLRCIQGQLKLKKG